VSVVHDALRRGSVSAKPAKGRSAHTDAVLAALGYQAARRVQPVRALVLVLVIIGAVAAAWGLWQRGARLEVRGTETRVAPPIIVTSAPVATPAAVTAPKAAPAPVASTATQPVTVAASAPPPRQPRNEPRSATVAPRAGPPASGLDPRTPADPFQLALYRHRAGDFEQALGHYQAALQRDEMNIEAHNNLGYLFLSKGLLEEAAREFQRVIAIEPKYVTAHVNLSATLYKLNRFDAAAAQAREALAIDSLNGDALVNLALAQKASGQPGDAQRSLRRALELDPRSAAAHYNLARQYEEIGEAARAFEHYRLFLQYAGPEQSAYAPDVRQRIQVLQTRIK